MVFSSLLFLFRFLPAVLLIYMAVPKGWKNGVLFLASLFFYAWGEPVYVCLMLFSTAVDYAHGRLVDFYLKGGNRKKARLTVISSVMINLSLLGFFKYTDFLTGTLNQVFSMKIPLLGLSLPIGISFYTFQTMSYTIDVYRGEAEIQKNIISFGAYVALFPQLIAGPIVRYQTIAEEIRERKVTFSLFGQGVWRFVIGLGKKVLFANSAGVLWEQVMAAPSGSVSALTAWLGILAFAFQIYFDFCGYSDMAIGLGMMFGFHFPENFRYPYQSKSITEFWRRWHISLGTWFREYVYIPLGGNQNGTLKTVRNLLIVWMLTGFWHGASWNFLLWGMYFGLVLILEKFWYGAALKKLPAAIQHLYALALIIGGWVLFAFEDIGQGLQYTSAMFGGNGMWMDAEGMYLLGSYGLLFFLLAVGSTELPGKAARWLLEKAGEKKDCLETIMKSVFLLTVLAVCTAYLVASSYNPFLYFRF